MDANQVLGSSKETENFRRLDRLIISGGTYVLRLLFDKLVPPNTLSTELAALKPDLESARFITADEREKLYPSTGNAPSSYDFDVTLFIKLLRRIRNLKEPRNGWNKLPSLPEHQNLEDDLARIKFYRNHVHGHVTMMSVKDADFEKLWSEISQPLSRIVHIADPDKEQNWKEAIEVLRTAPAVNEREINFERLLKMEIGEMRRSLTQQMRDIHLTAEKNTASVRETKTAVEEVHETVLQALSPPNSASLRPAVVINAHTININTNSNTALLPETLLAADAYKRLTAVDNKELPTSVKGEHFSQQPLERNVDTGQRYVLADQNRYQHRQIPQSEPTNIYRGDTTAWIPQGSPGRWAQQTVLRRPFSDPYGYGENGSSATNRTQICAATNEPSAWNPKQNLYSIGAYEDGSQARPLHKSFSAPVQNRSASKQRNEASVAVHGGIIRHPPETGGLLEMSIECQKIVWNDMELMALKEDVNIAIFRLLSSQPSNRFVQFLEKEKGLIVEDAQMKSNICALKLRAPRQDCVENLLQDYRNGKLDDLASRYLVSNELLDCYGVSRSDIILAVSIQIFEDCSTQKDTQDFQRRHEPRASSPVLRFTEGENPNFFEMTREKSISNPTPFCGPARHEVTSKSTARELFQIICRHGGSLHLNDAIEGLTQGHRHVIESGHESPHAFVQKFSNLFSLSNVKGLFLVHAVLAVQFCRNKSCSMATCPDLHVCPFYLVGSCSYNSLNCRRAHDVNGTHTEQVLRGLDLEGLSANEKTTLLTKIANDTKLKWRTPNSEIAQVCSYYNVERGCAKDSCNRLHVCRFWIKGKCKFFQCKRSHTYKSEREQRILKNYDMAGYPDAKINEILSPGIEN